MCDNIIIPIPHYLTLYKEPVFSPKFFWFSKPHAAGPLLNWKNGKTPPVGAFHRSSGGFASKTTSAQPIKHYFPAENPKNETFFGGWPTPQGGFSCPCGAIHLPAAPTDQWFKKRIILRGCCTMLQQPIIFLWSLSLHTANRGILTLILPQLSWGSFKPTDRELFVDRIRYMVYNVSRTQDVVLPYPI